MAAQPRHIRLDLAREPGHPHDDRRVPEFPDGGREETGLRLGDERLAPGEYVSIIASDGATHTCSVKRFADV